MRKWGGKLWTKLVEYLQSGTSPEKLAFTLALGTVVGVLPVWGVTTILCFMLAPIFKVNIAILQLVNYAVSPIQLMLMLPFIKIGTYVFNINPLPYSLQQLIQLFQIDFFLAMSEVGLAVALGIGMWALVSIPIFALIFLLSRKAFKARAKVQREL